MVAVVLPRSAPSAQLKVSVKTLAIPPAVPWPPAKPISKREPNSSFTPKTGVKRNEHRRHATPTCIKEFDQSQPRPAAASCIMLEVFSDFLTPSIMQAKTIVIMWDGIAPMLDIISAGITPRT